MNKHNIETKRTRCIFLIVVWIANIWIFVSVWCHCRITYLTKFKVTKLGVLLTDNRHYSPKLLLLPPNIPENPCIGGCCCVSKKYYIKYSMGDSSFHKSVNCFLRYWFEKPGTPSGNTDIILKKILNIYWTKLFRF